MLRILLKVRLMFSVICLLPSAPSLPAQEPEDAKFKKLTDDSRERVERIEVSVGEQARKPKLLHAPLMKYADLPRAIEVATLWVWEDDGRPAALVKVEAHSRPGGAKWLSCFTPIST